MLLEDRAAARRLGLLGFCPTIWQHPRYAHGSRANTCREYRRRLVESKVMGGRAKYATAEYALGLKWGKGVSIGTE